ncbi:MAG: hypothetical protein SGI97_02860 [candidate division Zixibacteria bacterium]|nr:hypothetical protein [candidate division Zixibacteria bacterium]
MIWPNNKQFAFTIFDDTDLATLQNVGPVYSLITDLGFHITKSVWPFAGTLPHPTMGATCEDAEYVDWLFRLREQGHEIGYHMATWHTSNRERTELALQRFEKLLGSSPSAMANHSSCEENIYWGPDRLSGIRKQLYNAVTFGRYRNKFRGHREGDQLFWGDLCLEKIRYVRNFIYPEMNTLKLCPVMPYYDPERPFVQAWYASSEGPEIISFNRLLGEANQDRLESEGGACIVYTHLGAGFYKNEKVDSQFVMLMSRLSKKNGWFVPVTGLLDYLRSRNGLHVITERTRARLEWQWLRFKLLKGRS